MVNQVQARPLPERRKAAIEHLRSNSNFWLATASDGRGPHLIPASYWWDGSRLTTATFAASRTLQNIQAQPQVRASIGSTSDVLMIDATAMIVAVADIDTEAAEGYARASRNDPRSVPGFVYVRLTPQRMQVWRGVAEFTGRTVMRGGVWLDEPVD
jgi:general stress protein 26